MKRLCAYCRRVLTAKTAYHHRRTKSGKRDFQAACIDCSRDRRLFFWYRKMGAKAVHALIERTEQKLRCMRLFVLYPELGPSALLDLYKRECRRRGRCERD